LGFQKPGTGITKVFCAAFFQKSGCLLGCVTVFAGWYKMSRSVAWLYSKEGRPLVPTEQWLRALLIQVLNGVRPERPLMARLDYNLLYRWFAGLLPDDPV
ncbi:MAG: transposase, partial [Acidocella sp.]|nr:transposase [Acidocella sp.]